MGVKVYVSGISGNKEVKKRQQRVFMILESKHIPYEVIDITEPGKENEKDFMQNNSTSLGITVSDINPRHPLPPQIFNESDYCGDYDQFDLANEVDNLEQFLKVEIPVQNNINHEVSPLKVVSEEKQVINVNETIERIAANGTLSSREASVEPEKVVEENIVTEKVDEVESIEVQEVQKENVNELNNSSENIAEEANDTPEIKNSTPSEAFIESERAVADE